MKGENCVHKIDPCLQGLALGLVGKVKVEMKQVKTYNDTATPNPNPNVPNLTYIQCSIK